MEQDVVTYFNEKIDWKFFNALMDRMLKYVDMGNLDYTIDVSFKLPKNHGYTRIFVYRKERSYYHPHMINDVIKHFEATGSELYYGVFINNTEYMDEFTKSLNNERYDYKLWRNGSYNAMYKKNDW